MKRIIALLILVVMIVSVFTGCGETKAIESATSESTVQAIATEKSEISITQNTDVTYPLTVKDYSETELVIEKKPEAIISLTLATDELLVEMVDESRIKAVTIYADDPDLSNILDIAKDIPVKLESEIEKVIELQPDLVFVADWKEKEFVQQLRDAKIPVYVFKAPTSFVDLEKAITGIAEITGEVEKGKVLVDNMYAKLKEIDDKVKTLKPEEKLTVLDYSFYGSTYAKGTSFDEITVKAGVINVATKAGLEGWPNISKEQIIELDPDIILLHAWSYDKNTDPQQFAETFKKDASFAGLKAVKNNRVYIMQDKHLQDNSQYMVLGVEDLAKVAYPDLFK
jgi:iron complex transport system substrate-binding protein